MTTEHPSHPDQLMAQTLGVCWHSPTSDRWVCQLADWEHALLQPCAACGCTLGTHGAYEGDSGCRASDCECDAFEAREACANEHGSGEVCVRSSGHGGHHHAGTGGLGWADEDPEPPAEDVPEHIRLIADVLRSHKSRGWTGTGWSCTCGYEGEAWHEHIAEAIVRAQFKADGGHYEWDEVDDSGPCPRCGGSGRQYFVKLGITR